MNVDRNKIDELFKEFHYADDLGVIKSKLTRYVAAVRKEVWQAALQFAKEEAVFKGRQAAANSVNNDEGESNADIFNTRPVTQ